MNYFTAQIKHYEIPEPVALYTQIHPSVVVVHGALAPDVMAFLEKMITAFGWSLDLCHHLIVEPETARQSHQMLWRKKELSLILSFGIPLADIGIYASVRPYSKTSIGTASVYLADSLEKLAASKELKSRIWNDLKGLDITAIS